MTKKKNIVITGILGQDGQILTNILLNKGYNIIGVVKKIPKKKKRKIKYQKINLLNHNKLSTFLDNSKLDTLIHLGTENPNYLELKRKKDFYKKNLKATKNLIDYFVGKKEKKLILVGTSQMYGKNTKKVNLNSKFNPKNSYAKFRVESYYYMKKKKTKKNTNISMAILFNHDSKYRKKKFLIPRLIKKIRSKDFEKIDEIYQENISGDFSHAEDICSGIYKLLVSKKNPNKLIFSSNKETRMNNIINYLLKINKIKKSFILKSKKKSLTPIGDNSITKRILNWKIKKNIFVAAKELNK